MQLGAERGGCEGCEGLEGCEQQHVSLQKQLLVQHHGFVAALQLHIGSSSIGLLEFAQAVGDSSSNTLKLSKSCNIRSCFADCNLHCFFLGVLCVFASEYACNRCAFASCMAQQQKTLHGAISDQKLQAILQARLCRHVTCLPNVAKMRLRNPAGLPRQG